MANKEQIIIDGVDVSECGHFYIRPEDRAVCCTNRVNCLCGANPNCDYKQLVRKMQEYEELKSESFTREELITLQEKDIDRYRKALEEIEKIAQNGLSPICYKSNCSRCQCYDGDDCNASTTYLMNNYFTDNGEFVDENCDFVEALEGLLEDERKKCNKARPIAQQILNIINKAKGEE